MRDFGGDHGDMARAYYGTTREDAVSEFPKRVRCPKCDGERYLPKFTIDLATGFETEEEVRCDECDEEGKVWVYE